MNLRERIIHSMHKTAELQGQRTEKVLNSGVILVDIGFDSLGIVILIASLEE